MLTEATRKSSKQPNLRNGVGLGVAYPKPKEKPAPQGPEMPAHAEHARLQELRRQFGGLLAPMPADIDDAALVSNPEGAGDVFIWNSALHATQKWFEKIIQLGATPNDLWAAYYRWEPVNGTVKNIIRPWVEKQMASLPNRNLFDRVEAEKQPERALLELRRAVMWTEAALEEPRKKFERAQAEHERTKQNLVDFLKSHPWFAN